MYLIKTNKFSQEKHNEILLNKTLHAKEKNDQA